MNNKILKNKVVEFPLSKTMRLPDLVKSGFQRYEIIALFKDLQSKNLGTYKEGTLGKGNCATFEFSGEFSPKHTMTFQVEKLHSEYAGKPQDNSPPMKISTEDATKLADSLLQNNTKITETKPISTAIVHVGATKTSLTANKYSIVVEDGGLRVSLVDKGADTIESALTQIWSSIKDKIHEPNCQHMTQLESVSSKLMGRGYYKFL